MDIKDINIRNLQTEVIRLRNLLADRDALVKSMEHDREEWTNEARAGYISLEEHFSEIESLRKDNSLENSRLQKELDETKSRLSVAEVRIKELEEAALKSEETHKKELSKYNEVVDFITTNKRNPSKFVPEERGLRNWVRHQQKLVNKGELKPERVEMFEKLLELCEENRHVNQYV